MRPQNISTQEMVDSDRLFRVEETEIGNVGYHT
jgi:hypothetical protein